MKITVMMPVYNTKAEWLEESIESALVSIRNFNEKYGKESELLIGNDGSTNEDTLRTLAKYEIHENVRIVHKENRGLSCILNDMLYNYTNDTEFICYFESDDIMSVDRLEVQYEYMNRDEYKHITIIGANTQNNIPWFNGRYRICKLYNTYHSTNDIQIMQQNPFCHPTIFYRRSHIIDNNIHYNENDNYTCDWNFYCDIFTNKLWALFIPDKVIHYRQHNDQISRAHHKDILVNIQKYKKQYGINDTYHYI